MDVRMPGRDGLSAARELGEQADPPKVVMLTTFDMDEYVHSALRAGAVGFLLKDTPPRDLTEAVRTVAAGNAMLSPTVTRRLIRTFAGRGLSQAEVAKQRLGALTERELEVVLRGRPRTVQCGDWPRAGHGRGDREGACEPRTGQTRCHQPGSGRDPGPRRRARLAAHLVQVTMPRHISSAVPSPQTT